MSDDDDDDFYMILPSNGCKDTHPDNTANKFITSWERAINFKGNWKVALTEANLSYTTTSINREFGILCFAPDDGPSKVYVTGRLVGNVSKKEVRLIMPDLPMSRVPNVMITTPRCEYLSLEDKLYDIVITSSFPIGIAVKGVRETSNRTGGPPYTIHLGMHHFCTLYESEEKCPPKSLRNRWRYRYHSFVFDAEVIMEFVVPSVKRLQEIHADEDLFWSNVEEMVDGLKNVYKDVFKDVKIYEGKLVLYLQPNLVAIEFTNGFNIALGILEAFHTGGVISARREPFLRYGINNMYIYSSICRPIRVGETCVPLLKSLWINGENNNKRSFGEIRNIVVKNPMYIPLSSASINTVEVNIRSDSGDLIPFVAGSVTSLTLHFKRKKRKQ